MVPPWYVTVSYALGIVRKGVTCTRGFVSADGRLDSCMITGEHKTARKFSGPTHNCLGLLGKKEGDLIMSDQDLQSVIVVLQVMRQAEAAVAEFYAICSESFPLSKEFWGRLAREEAGHATVIDNLLRIIFEHPEEFEVGDSSPLEALQAFVSRVNENLAKVRTGQIKEGDALLMAYLIENTFVEGKYTEAVKTKNISYAKTLEKMASAEVAHKDIVVRKMKEQKEGD